MPKDHYITLGVQPDASAGEIHDAYRDLVRAFHPDLNPGDPRAKKRFQEVQAAFEVLSNPVRRAEYDCTERSSIAAEDSAGGVRDEVDETQLAAKVFVAIRRQSDSRPYRFDSHGSPYVTAMIDVTIAWVLVGSIGVLLAAFALSIRVGPTELSAEEISCYAGSLAFWGRVLCSGATLVYAIVMVVFFRERFGQ